MKHYNGDNMFLRVVYIIRRRLWLFVIIGLLGGAAGALYAYLSKVSFKAVTTFALEDEGGASRGGGLLGLASQFGLDFSMGGAGIFTRDNITELLLSRRIIEETLLSTAKVNGFDATLADHILKLSEGITKQKEVKFPVGITRSLFTSAQDSAMNDIYQHVAKKVIEIREPDKRRNIFLLIVLTPDAQFSKIFSERLMASASSFYIETKTKRAKITVDILQNRVDSLWKVINRTAYGRAAISDANVNPLFQQSQVNAMLKQSELSVAVTAYGEIIKNLEIAKYTLLRQTPLIQIIDSPQFPLEKKGHSRLITAIIGSFTFVFLFLIIVVAMQVFKKPEISLKRTDIEHS